MKDSPRLQAERRYVEKMLGDSVICEICATNLRDYAEKCIAGLSDCCQGFNAIEKAKEDFNGATSKG